ncbi:unnamed protein product [Auanema sp. JU1783]|nr:unnamed protein product [Auanema sp. JU1783]
MKDPSVLLSKGVQLMDSANGCLLTCDNEKDFENVKKMFTQDVTLDDLEEWKSSTEMELYTAKIFLEKSRYYLSLSPPDLVQSLEKIWFSAVFAVKKLFLLSGGINLKSHKALSYFCRFAIANSELVGKRIVFLMDCWTEAEQMHQDAYGSWNYRPHEYSQVISNVEIFVKEFQNFDQRKIWDNFEKTFIVNTKKMLRLEKFLHRLFILVDLNYQFALLSSEIPAEQYEAVQDKLEQARLNMSEKLSAGGINATLLAALTKPKTFNSLHSPDGFGNFPAFNRSVSKFPWFPRNHTWVNPGSEGTTVLPASPLNDLTDISKRFRNFSMPARLDPYYDRMVELAEQNKTSDLKALVQDVLQIQPQDNPLQTLINLFKSRAPTHDAPSLPKNLTNTSDKKTMSEMLSSKVSEVMSSDQMKTIKSKLETAWNSI